MIVRMGSFVSQIMHQSAIKNETHFFSFSSSRMCAFLRVEKISQNLSFSFKFTTNPGPFANATFTNNLHG